MRPSVIIFALVGLFIASTFVEEALGKKPEQLVIKITAKVPSKAQLLLDKIEAIVAPIRDSLQLEELEQALPKKTKRVAPKKADKPALGWDIDKRQVKYANR